MSAPTQLVLDGIPLPTTQIIVGDALESLRAMPSESVQCIVTSPPYLGLRDYGMLGQIGLETSIGAYVQALVDVFAEARRVLRSDGTLWLNIGDAYAGSYGAQGKQGAGGEMADRAIVGPRQVQAHPDRAPMRERSGLPDKSLMGMPWRVAFALMEEGWILRSDIIWSKLNPLPESVRDRPTKAHEYLFLFARSARYHYDAAAIAEASSGREAGNKVHKGASAYELGDERMRTKSGLCATRAKATRNRRTVWPVASEPFHGAHFAAFPTKLVEPCILAGCPRGGVVLDPFGGSGRTALVANRLGRNAILIELNPEYAEMARELVRGGGSR